MISTPPLNLSWLLSTPEQPSTPHTSSDAAMAGVVRRAWVDGMGSRHTWIWPKIAEAPHVDVSVVDTVYPFFILPIGGTGNDEVELPWYHQVGMDGIEVRALIVASEGISLDSCYFSVRTDTLVTAPASVTRAPYVAPWAEGNAAGWYDFTITTVGHHHYGRWASWTIEAPVVPADRRVALKFDMRWSPAVGDPDASGLAARSFDIDIVLVMARDVRRGE